MEVLSTFFSARALHTERSYRGIFAEWQRSLGGVAYSEAGEIHALGFLRTLRSGDSSQATIHRKIVILHAIYEFLKRSGEVGINPFTNVVDLAPRGETGLLRPHEALTSAQVNALFSASANNPRDHAIFAVLFGGALRISEVVSLDVGDINFHENTAEIVISNTKRGGAQRVVLSERFSAIIFTLFKQRIEKSGKEAPLFTTASRWGTTNCRMSTSTLRRLVKGYYSAVGVPSTVTIHSTRATAITRLLEAGMPYREVQEFSRHSSVQMVERYDKRRFDISNAPGKKLLY